MRGSDIGPPRSPRMYQSVSRVFLCLSLAAASFGCGGPSAGGMGGMGAMPDANRMQKQSELMQKLASEPDLPPWYAQRERVAA